MTLRKKNFIKAFDGTSERCYKRGTDDGAVEYG